MDSEDADSAIAMAFGKDPTNVKDRKDLVVRTTANPPAAETYRANVPISRFFQTDYAIYAEYDVDRKIPSVCDGLKTCARKIMWVAWERNYVCSASRVKVAQLGAAVAERTMYLHGETSLSTAVVTLAQNFTGTNNCSLLFPDGDFGTRVGNPPSAARYIHTHLTDFASSIFSKLDKAVMKYRTEEGVSIEPAVLYPCLPPILINGNQCAIATGFSCEVPSYKPEDVMANVRNFIAGRAFVDMTPWFRGFTGKVLPGALILTLLARRIFSDVTQICIGVLDFAPQLIQCSLSVRIHGLHAHRERYERPVHDVYDAIHAQARWRATWR